ncbi:MAG: sterol desaturase family protein [Solirubrobacteraceae bacterium]
MGEVILYAIPAFVVLLVLEVVSLRAESDYVGYERRDSTTSLTMGLGSVLIGLGWRVAAVAAYAGLYELTPLRMSPGSAWSWLLLFFADDLAFYAYHRVHHEVRLFWAQHVVHHSSTHFNLSTALRQPWVEMTALPFWLPLALLGFPPWMILTQQAISLIYQFWIHTERIGTLPAPIELVFNTPSHHRVHHGSNDIYLDRNYGGILIIWDRLFGSFQAEGERVRYGLTKNIETFNPLRVVSHEWLAIWRDARAACNWRERLAFIFARPGWTPLEATAAAVTPATTGEQQNHYDDQQNRKHVSSLTG